MAACRTCPPAPMNRAMGRWSPRYKRTDLGLLQCRTVVVSAALVASLALGAVPSHSRAGDARNAVRPTAAALVGKWDFEDFDELLAVDGNSTTLSVTRRSAGGRARLLGRFGRSRSVPVRISRGRVIISAQRRVGRRSGRVRYVGRLERTVAAVVLEGRITFLRPRLEGRSSFRVVKRIRSPAGSSTSVGRRGRLGASAVLPAGRPGS